MNWSSSCDGEVTSGPEEGFSDSTAPTEAVVPGEIAPGDAKVTGWTPSEGTLIADVDNGAELVEWKVMGSEKLITLPPCPLDWELGESTDCRFVRPPQFSRTL